MWLSWLPLSFVLLRCHAEEHCVNASEEEEENYKDDVAVMTIVVTTVVMMIIIDNFCRALFSGVPKLTALNDDGNDQNLQSVPVLQSDLGVGWGVALSLQLLEVVVMAVCNDDIAWCSLCCCRSGGCSGHEHCDAAYNTQHGNCACGQHFAHLHTDTPASSGSTWWYVGSFCLDLRCFCIISSWYPLITKARVSKTKVQLALDIWEEKNWN